MVSQFRQELEAPWTALLGLLEEFGRVQDRLDPNRLREFQERLAPHAQAVKHFLDSSELLPLFKQDPAGQILSRALSQAWQGVSRFAETKGPQEMLKAFQAIRPVARAQEILYALSGSIDDVSRYFLTPSCADNAVLLASLRVQADRTGAPRGIIQVNNERGRRGGYSLYVPEYYSDERKWPLVVALHGGSGHGADFLWSWLFDARSSGFLLAAPSSLDRTWSLRSVGADAASLNRMLEQISGSYNVNPDRILLTGISDGGTYAMLLSIVHQSPFTHYAPVAAAVHVLLRDGAVAAPVQGLRIYQVHGARDWMFPVAHAQAAASALESAGAQIVYSQIEDLSHNYPRDENEKIVRWFLE
jgi:phospholipase/carboxylesterase